MTKFLLNISAIALSTVLATSATAQEKTVSKPIFINQYSPTVPTYESNVPNMVRSTGQSQYSQATRTYTKPNRVSGGPTYDEPFNPFGPGFGRIRSEKDFYDIPTKQYYEQYDYFKLLADRGDTAGLRAAVEDVQKNGVFDPAKYKAAMQGVQAGGTSPQAPATQQVILNSPSRKKVTNNLRESDMPTKIHKGYDDPINPSSSDNHPVNTPRKNQPIFLK